MTDILDMIGWLWTSLWLLALGIHGYAMGAWLLTVVSPGLAMLLAVAAGSLLMGVYSLIIQESWYAGRRQGHYESANTRTFLTGHPGITEAARSFDGGTSCPNVC